MQSPRACSSAPNRLGRASTWAKRKPLFCVGASGKHTITHALLLRCQQLVSALQAARAHTAALEAVADAAAARNSALEQELAALLARCVAA